MTEMTSKAEPRYYLQQNTKNISDCYDAIVIGTGVGGLTCATYLAKAGLKVLMLEKHYVPGGYCGSFWKKGYYFDAGAHYLGSCRREGQIGRLLVDHGLEDRIQFIKVDPSDVFITRNHEIKVWQDFDRFVEELQNHFPKESHRIRQFMDYITKSNPLQLYADLRAKTFAQVLDGYFTDVELKSIFSIPLGNIAVPSTEASALTTIFLYREFILDGGYYPKGGMQALPDILMERFREYGGELLFLASAQAINVENGRAAGVRLKVYGGSEVEVRARIVVANCDPHQLANQLLCHVNAKELDGIRGLLRRRSSASAIMVHLGVKQELRGIAKYESNVWHYPGTHIDDYYAAIAHGELGLEKGFLFFSIPSLHDAELLPRGRHSIQAIIGAPFKPRNEWESQGFKERIAEEIVRRIDNFIPGLTSWIDVKLVATPPTLIKYTSNYEGAMYGWASTPDQVGNTALKNPIGIGGLFLVGHWADVPTGHSGIATVVASGRSVARTILRARKSQVNA